MHNSLPSSLRALVTDLQTQSATNLQHYLDLPNPTFLDENQARSLISALQQQVALIQGPPGTGKSFIGALAAKTLFRHSSLRILVLSYTNHALDQYLEDLLTVDIPSSEIVRLGSPYKASNTAKPLTLQQQLISNPNYRRTRQEWDLINHLRNDLSGTGTKLAAAFNEYTLDGASKKDLMEYLELSPEHEDFYEAFQVASDDEFQVVGQEGKAIDKYYLLDRWCRGKDPGVLKEQISVNSSIWAMPKDERDRVRRSWLAAIFTERLGRVTEYGELYDQKLAMIDKVSNEGSRKLLASKRIIGCTTTGAAIHVQEIQSARPDVVIVEEAGEILESHILTALGPSTKQLILIGDHKQLRPKANYQLSVEKGTGYDLNRSLFERLVLKGYPHETLVEQHRMRPEISALVRSLTYPELKDASSTEGRKHLRGFQDTVIFVDHRELESEKDTIFDPREGGATSSKTNRFEADMTLRCVRYLAQQGYGTDQVVVLTPYLGQLGLLYDVLAAENDPVLNDMDSFDLVRAGLMPQATAAMNRRRLRISTVDNYQGEESDIVVVSLTRSNMKKDIGFLSSPERLNVLLSRARDGLIMIGNSETFGEARKGKELWQSLFKDLRNGHHIFDGVPVCCERHKDRMAIVPTPRDFDSICPDGGCNAPCGTMLSCDVHQCPQKCHQLYDHSKMKCEAVMVDTCADNHKLSWKCGDGRPPQCLTCEKKKRATADRLKKEHEQRLRATIAQKEHEQQIAGIEAKIEAERQQLKEHDLQQARQIAIEQKLRDLALIKQQTMQKMQNDMAAGPAQSHGRQSQPPTIPAISNEHAGGITNEAAQASVPGGLPSKLDPVQSSELSSLEPKGPAGLEWDRMKDVDGISVDAIDKIMDMTGLEDVKAQFLGVLQKLQIAQRQGTSLQDERLGTSLLGNPGTGKTSVARLYASFLAEVQAIPSDTFVETTGSKLANEGVNGAKKMLDDVLEAGGGAIFIDEAYQLVSGSSFGGSGVLDFLLAEIENTTGRVVFMFAGYEKQMEKFFQHNPGIPSRLPVQLKFADYSEKQLLYMLGKKIEKRFANRMKIEDGYTGLYMRIVVRRLHRQSGKEGFGNARALENVLARITTSQSTRIARERRAGKLPDDLWLSKEDLIGPEPSGALDGSDSWRKLQAMVGLRAVKDSVKMLLDSLTENYNRELKEKPPIEVTLNRLFLGSPGTGKTTVAKLYGRILADIGLLSTSECVVKTPSDFIGSAMGESERNTKSILENTKGKVLVIDEAYMLCSTLGIPSSSVADPYRTAVIDTIVSEVHSVPGDDRAVLLLGYQEQMEEMLRKVNPGLRRRFPVENAFVFEDYQDDELRSILDFKLSSQGLDATEDARQACVGLLSKLRRKPNFGNAGEVENLLTEAKQRYMNRQRALPAQQRSEDVIFSPQDFDRDFGRSSNAVESCKALFADTVNSEEIVDKLTRYIRGYQNAQKTGMDPLDVVPFNFTTTARKMGKVFCDMGFLASDHVIECSVTDLVAEYTGQTGPKVIAMFEEALGQVLFIDEAYRLAEGPFAKEAIDEIVDCLTKPRYKGKMLVMLAGYEHEISRLLRVNPGLSSRFPEEVTFSNLTPGACLTLLTTKLLRDKKLPSDLNVSNSKKEAVLQTLDALTKLDGWGNGRDVETIANRVRMDVLSSAEAPLISWDKILVQAQRMLQEKQSRMAAGLEKIHIKAFVEPQAQASADMKIEAPRLNTVLQSTTTTRQEAEPPLAETGDHASKQFRDPNVPDAIWNQLQIDRLGQERARTALTQQVLMARRQSETARQAAEDMAKQEQELAEKAAIDDEARRLHEQMRLKALEARRKADEEAERIRALEEQRRLEQEREQRAQQKLRQIGVCPVGYHWINQGIGYRCAGGSHFVTNEALGLS
ncbi:hypothetical protein KVT40_005404 [Elsinoe batatas]|uniref:AAA+ ATPase domain-containing protein n=1 Tax=Elsinoe batatas TaxID=2601811 RepID=A0A8K0PIB4_9PEZI|nr:hypothetical protein KVT40_005404 [Elsinoe batatas]